MGMGMLNKKVKTNEGKVDKSSVEESTTEENLIAKESFLERFSPVRVFPNTNVAARFWFYVAVFLFFVALVQPIPYWVSMNNRQMAAVMDQAGQIYMVPLTNINEAVKMQEQIAKQAAKALLMKNPNGFDEPNELKQLFLKPVYKKIMLDSKKQTAKFKKRDIHQKCEILNIDLLKKAAGYVIVRIKGQLQQSGIYQSQRFTDNFKYIMDLKLVKNPKLGQNYRLPYAVSTFAINTKRMKEVI